MHHKSGPKHRIDISTEWKNYFRDSFNPLYYESKIFKNVLESINLNLPSVLNNTFEFTQNIPKYIR